MQQPIELDEDLALRELELKWSFQKGFFASVCLAKAMAGPPPEKKHDDKMLKSQGLAQYVIKGPAVFHVEVDGDSVLSTGGLGTCTLHVISSPRVMVDGRHDQR
ncbi:hypothetical protein B0T13DRAFT_512952 [Neurospora crassa]|nr:hypothetical protein B0T13DRAFT_512952 [Neurospora crassa]